jgi:hypothetical protein
MSLDVILLGLPAKIRRLRGNNAGVTPLTKAVRTVNYNVGTTAVAGIVDDFQNWRPDHYTEALLLTGLSPNNALETSTEVCNITGPGVLDGVWLLMYTRNAVITGSPYIYGVEIIVDGVDIVPPGWRLDQSLVSTPSYYILGDAPLGDFHVRLAYGTSSVRFPVFAPSSFRIPFKESLVVNLIHYETGSANFRTACWVNAWKTE